MSVTAKQEDIKRLIACYEEKIFALALYLIGGDRNKTYDIATSCFAEVIRKSSVLKPSPSFLAAVAGQVIERCGVVKALPTLDNMNWVGVSELDKGILNIVVHAMQSLSYHEKALILLRDQLNLPYQDIAAIFKTNEKKNSGSNDACAK